MRTLKFIVTGQTIRPDPACDFSGISPGTKGYLKAEFSFDKEWNGCRKAAVFTSLQKEHPVPVIGNKCEIPEEALSWRKFSIRMVGEKDRFRITTNDLEVMQNG